MAGPGQSLPQRAAERGGRVVDQVPCQSCRAGDGALMTLRLDNSQSATAAKAPQVIRAAKEASLPCCSVEQPVRVWVWQHQLQPPNPIGQQKAWGQLGRLPQVDSRYLRQGRPPVGPRRDVSLAEPPQLCDGHRLDDAAP